MVRLRISTSAERTRLRCRWSKASASRHTLGGISHHGGAVERSDGRASRPDRRIDSSLCRPGMRGSGWRTGVSGAPPSLAEARRSAAGALGNASAWGCSVMSVDNFEFNGLSWPELSNTPTAIGVRCCALCMSSIERIVSPDRGLGDVGNSAGCCSAAASSGWPSAAPSAAGSSTWSWSCIEERFNVSSPTATVFYFCALREEETII